MAARQATATRERPAQNAQAPQQAPAGNLPAAADQADKPHPMTVLKGQLEDRQNEFAFVLPDHMPPARFTRVILTAVQMNPKLLLCTRVSLFNAALKAAQDGLLPDGREGAIVDYKGKGPDGKEALLAQWMPMYQGLLKKVRNSGEFKWMTAQIVFEGDLFEHWIDSDGEHFKHEPQGISETPIRAYSAVTTKSGGAFVEVMTMKQVAKVRAASRVKSEYGPWAKWFEEMAKKTAFRRLAKRLPISSDLDDLIRRDDGLYDFDGQREEAQVERQDRRRLTTSAAFDQFAGGATIDHDAETGEVNDEDFGSADAGSDDFNGADAELDATVREEAARQAAEAEKAKQADAEKQKAAEAEKARLAEAAKTATKKEDPISSGPQGAAQGSGAADKASAAPPADDKGATSAGASDAQDDPGAADRDDAGVDAQDRRWPNGATPSNEDEYENFAETTIADFTEGSQVAPWWKSKEQIDLRKACGVKQATFDRILKKAQNRVAELKKSGK